MRDPLIDAYNVEERSAFTSGRNQYLSSHFHPFPSETYMRGTPMSRCKRRRYGLMSFLFDVIMVTITGGLWLIWIFVREMRR